MSKFISFVYRNPFNSEEAKRRLACALEEITPDLLAGQARIEVAQTGWHFQGVLNLPAQCPRRGLSLCQGMLFEPEGYQWWLPDSGHPDGSYAIVRENVQYFEALADAGCSRSLWVYFDDEMFAVSNSQRAITICTGRFEFNREVVPWLISSGSLGPENSYNKHLFPVAPSGRVLLDKVAWKLQADAPDVCFEEVKRSDAKHAAALDEAISETLSHFDPKDADNIVLGLSGGSDSRALACFLHRLYPGTAWRTFSSGPEASPEVPGSDPAVAAELARGFGFRHDFYINDISPEPAELRLRRFLLCSEGRIDHFKAYAGGMHLLKILFDQGVHLSLRGDQGLGKQRTPSGDEVAARRAVDFILCGDYAAFAGQLARLGLASQQLPAAMAQRPVESLDSWRDRLDHVFRKPVVLNALAEAKAGFVDGVSPLYSKRVHLLARGLPDHLREDKSLLRGLTRRYGPDLPFARESGIAKVPDVLQHPAIRRELEASLGSDTAAACFGEPFVAWLQQELRRSGSLAYRARNRIGRVIGRRRAGGTALLQVSVLRLALRVHMGTFMADQLVRDAALFPAGAGQARDHAA